MLDHVVANIQARVFHRRVVSKLVNAGADSALHPLADGPVLAIHQVPELHGVRRVKRGLGDFLRMKKKVADDVRAVRSQWPQEKSRDVIAGEADHQIWKAQLTLVANFFVFAQAGKRRAIRRPLLSKSVGAGAMWNSVFPVEIRTAGLLEVGNDFTKFRVKAPAVVALVIVLHDELPIGGHIVGDAMARSKRGKRITASPFNRRPKLRPHAVFFSCCCGRQIQVQEEKSAPRVHSDGIQRKIFFAEAFRIFQVWRSEKLTLQIVCPLMIRAADRTGRRDASLEMYIPICIILGSTKARTTVAAYVVMGAQFTLHRSNDENTLSRNFQNPRTPRGGELLLAAGAKPVLRKDQAFFSLKNLGRCVEVAGK